MQYQQCSRGWQGAAANGQPLQHWKQALQQPSLHYVAAAAAVKAAEQGTDTAGSTQLTQLLLLWPILQGMHHSHQAQQEHIVAAVEQYIQTYMTSFRPALSFCSSRKFPWPAGMSNDGNKMCSKM
jgi:hypothetical protein